MTVSTDSSREKPEKLYVPRLPEDSRWRLVFATHARRITLLGDANLLPDDWRNWALKYVTGMLKRCPHTQRSLFEVENEHGVWGVEICVECGQLAAGPECPHVSMTWKADGKLLICDNCGHDGT